MMPRLIKILKVKQKQVRQRHLFRVNGKLTGNIKMETIVRDTRNTRRLSVKQVLSS
jgi:hypothetical protein